MFRASSSSGMRGARAARERKPSLEQSCRISWWPDDFDRVMKFPVLYPVAREFTQPFEPRDSGRDISIGPTAD